LLLDHQETEEIVIFNKLYQFYKKLNEWVITMYFNTCRKFLKNMVCQI